MACGALGGQVWAYGWCSACTGPACTLSPVWGLAGGLGGWGASCPGLTLVQVPGDEMCCAFWPREGGLGAFQCLVVAKESPLTRKPWKAETWPLGWRVEATVNPGLVGPLLRDMWPWGRLPAEAAAGWPPGLTWALSAGVLEDRTALLCRSCGGDRRLRKKGSPLTRW